MTDVLRPLLARVKTEKGLEVVHRGEEVPANALEGEAERLLSITDAEGAPILGEPFKTSDEIAVDEAELARANFEADVEAEAGASEETKLSADPDPEAIDAFVADATADEIVAAANANPAVASDLVAAEVELRGDDARKTVLALDES